MLDNLMTVFRIRLLYHFNRTSVQDRGFLAVISTYPEYSLDTTIVEFFTQPSATRDIKAKDLATTSIQNRWMKKQYHRFLVFKRKELRIYIRNDRLYRGGDLDFAPSLLGELLSRQR